MRFRRRRLVLGPFSLALGARLVVVVVGPFVPSVVSFCLGYLYPRFPRMGYLCPHVLVWCDSLARVPV